MRFVLLSYFLMAAFGGHAQQVLLSENFNDCKMPDGWSVNIKGNPNAVWRVGYAQNNDAKDASIDGSCFVLIDDDSTGENTPAYVWDLISKPFDASKFSTIRLNADIHFRDWKDANESFQVLIQDGTGEKLLSTFGPGLTNGELFADHFDYTYDLSLVTQSEQVRLIFRYDDGNGFGWWAGIDNVLVTGVGGGTNILTETFDQCKLPNGWETKIVEGNEDWKFGVLDTLSEAYKTGNSMNGSCFAFFDDDYAGEKAPPSTIRLLSPWFDGSAFSNYFITLDVILRFEKEKIAIIVQKADGSEHLVRASEGDVGGPGFPKFLSPTLDLTPFRDKQMRIILEYTDGGAWGWWAGVDNVKITAIGESIDLCSKAKNLSTAAPCLANNNLNAIFDGPAAACAERNVGSLWYKWKADFSGVARFTSNAQFNDLVNVYSGGCQSLNALQCNDRDEHGFVGESTWFQAQAGTEYLIRVSGKEGNFGIARGDVCVKIEPSALPAFPSNEDCATAIPLTVDAACISSGNRNAATSKVLPSLNKLARADVWYTFVAPALALNEKLLIESAASFSDIITVYKGSCANLEEVAGNHKGSSLELSGLSAGQRYWIQIAGNFATIEGRFCIRISKKSKNIPANDNCAAAINVPLGAPCMAVNTQDATFSGKKPGCVVTCDRDVWFKFTAPVSGSINLNSGADFEHVMAIWQGDCNDLKPFYCSKNPLRCQGFLHIGGLESGKTYFVQIATWSQGNNLGAGDLCLKITDGNTQPDFEALVLQVNEKCTGKNTAEIKVKASGGVAPLTVQGTQSGDVVGSGAAYLVVVTDAKGCQQSHTGIAKPCDASECTLAGVAIALDPLCKDQKNGTLTANPSGGKQPLTYKWSNGASTQSLTGIGSGIYTVTMTDADDCEHVVTDTLFNPSALSATPLEIKQPWIGQNNGKIDLELNGGKPPYTSDWFRNGQLFAQNAEDLSNAPAGEYRIAVTDANGCTASFTFTLTETVSTHTPDTGIYLEIYPNPARDKATLAMALTSASTVYLRLTDASGRTLQSWTLPDVSEQNLRFEVGHLPAGNYQLQLLCANGKKTLKPLVVVR